MNILLMLTFAVSLAMDAFAVSISKGLCTPKATVKKGCIVGAWFGGFQGIMPLLGYLLGTVFASFADRFMPWISFVLLSLIGANMIREALSTEEDSCESDSQSFSFMPMLVMAIATSIDAFGVGITFTTAFENIVEVLVAVALIAIVTFGLSFAGLFIGNRFGAKHQKLAEIAGGIILIGLGIKNIVDIFI